MRCYWGSHRLASLLKSLEDIQATPLISLSQTPLYQHIISSIPSLRTQIQNAVTASMKQWLLEIRNVTGTVGKAAIEAMDARARKWRSRREKDLMLRLSRVGSAVEVVTYERSESMSELHLVYHRHFTVCTADNVLDQVKVDFQPLYQCIHIYMSLDSLDELRNSYQADRKACDQLHHVLNIANYDCRRNQTSYFPSIFHCRLYPKLSRRYAVSLLSSLMFWRRHPVFDLSRKLRSFGTQ